METFTANMSPEWFPGNKFYKNQRLHQNFSGLNLPHLGDSGGRRGLADGLFYLLSVVRDSHAMATPTAS